MPALTLRTLKRELAAWQERLGLTNWTITLRWGKRREMRGDNGDNVGMCWWSAEEEEATVLLARDHRNSAELRHTLIHELLHIRLQGHTTYDGAYCEMYERALNRVAAALLE